MPNTWTEALQAYRYPVDLRRFSDATKHPGWFTRVLKTGDPQETLAFEGYFRKAASDSIESWFEVIFWKLYSNPLARQQQTRRLIANIHAKGITSHVLFASCLEYVNSPSNKTFDAFRKVLGIEGPGIAIAATFPAFLAADKFPMIDRRIAKWVEFSYKEFNEAMPDSPRLLPPFHQVLEGEFLTMQDFDFALNWIHWCRYMAGKLTTATSFGWRARDVEMAVFQAWGRNTKSKTQPEIRLHPLSSAPGSIGERIPTNWSFQFSIPTVPKGQPVTMEQAEAYLLDKLSSQEKGWQDAMWEVVRFYGMTNRPVEALKYLERLLTNATDLEALASHLLAMGQMMEQLQAFDAAITFYSRALALSPTATRTWYFINNNLGYCLNQLKRHEEAEPYCRAAIQIDPNRHNAYKNLGVSLEGQDKIGEAAKGYIAAVRANAADPRALQLLENLVAQNPELPLEIPDIFKQLQNCREAVGIATAVQRYRDD